MRVVKIINMNTIKTLDRFPLCPRTLDLAKKLENNVLTIHDLPPIHTMFENGSHTIMDGRHRYTAIRLAGINQMKAKYGTK